MAAIMTKRGGQDNIITYEFMCDSVADLNKIDPNYVTMGSVAIVINDFEVYMANSQKQWVNLAGGDTAEEQGGES